MRHYLWTGMLILGVASSAWAWPPLPSAKNLESSPAVECDASPNICRTCLENCRQRIENFRCVAEEFRDKCESFNEGINDERAGLDKALNENVLPMETYKQKMIEYHDHYAQYKMCISEYRVASRAYDRKISLCKDETSKCLARPVSFGKGRK